MATVSLDKVSKTYPNGAPAVQDLDLEVAEGELMVMVGPSGSGKTTALRMVAGLEDITSGTLRLGGQVVNDLSPKDRNVAMVFQSYALYPHMTVAENIGFALRLRKMPKDQVRAKVAETAQLLGLSEYLDRKPGQLSGGQRQRVAMGRAVVREPSVFLMDEPLSNLDAKMRVQMRSEISRIQRRVGVATLYVTHDQTEAMTMGDRVAVLHMGRLQQCDTPQVLYDRPDNIFVAAFIGSPAMNLYEAALNADATQLQAGQPVGQPDPRDPGRPAQARLLPLQDGGDGGAPRAPLRRRPARLGPRPRHHPRRRRGAHRGPGQRAAGALPGRRREGRVPRDQGRPRDRGTGRPAHPGREGPRPRAWPASRPARPCTPAPGPPFRSIPTSSTFSTLPTGRPSGPDGQGPSGIAA